MISSVWVSPFHCTRLMATVAFLSTGTIQYRCPARPTMRSPPISPIKGYSANIPLLVSVAILGSLLQMLPQTVRPHSPDRLRRRSSPGNSFSPAARSESLSLPLFQHTEAGPNCRDHSDCCHCSGRFPDFFPGASGSRRSRWEPYFHWGWPPSPGVPLRIPSPCRSSAADPADSAVPADSLRSHKGTAQWPEPTERMVI